MSTFSDVFHYLERTFLIREERKSFWQHALQQVKTQINEETREKLVQGVLYLIQQDREKDSIEHRELISKLVHVMLALEFYQIFEAGFCNDTREFYLKEGTKAFD